MGACGVTAYEYHVTMRSPFTFAALALQLGLSAQCTFTPTITPAEVILCPGEGVELGTQVYASYQWYRDGQPIAGATQQTLAVDYFSDSGYSFTVLAEEDGCFEQSAPVLVDGWVFLPPYVIHEGDEPIDVGPNGESFYCEGAFVQLSLGMPYTENITWTLNGQPIPGANEPTLVVTASGSYSASAAPSVCPSSITPLGVTVEITFVPPTQPVISEVDGQLCATPPGETYQWYLNGVAILSTNTPCIQAEEAGSYTVRVFYPNNCQVISDPYLSTAIHDQQASRPWKVLVSEGHITVTWDGAVALGTYWSISDVQGRSVRNGFMPMYSPLRVDVTDLPAGVYLFQAAHHHKALAPATRFTVTR